MEEKKKLEREKTMFVLLDKKGEVIKESDSYLTLSTLKSYNPGSTILRKVIPLATIADKLGVEVHTMFDSEINKERSFKILTLEDSPSLDVMEYLTSCMCAVTANILNKEDGSKVVVYHVNHNRVADYEWV